MLGGLEPTPYDLRFRVVGIPVRVSVWFWIVGAVMGYSSLDRGLEFLLAWLAVLFVSILVHELGHALAARSFGYSPSILLYHFGGLAFYQPFGRHSHQRSMLISLAGPGAGFVLYGIIRLWAEFGYPGVAGMLSERADFLIRFCLAQLLWINLVWGLINLLPVLPLDGGRITEEFCRMRSPFRGPILAIQISVFTAGLAAAAFFAAQMTYPAILFAVLCANNVSALQQFRRW